MDAEHRRLEEARVGEDPAMKIPLIAAASLLCLNAGATAGPYDGSTPMRCAIQTAMICDNPTICVRGTAATVNLPPVLVVDVPNRLISGAATGRTIKIMSVDHGPGKLILRGLDVQTLGVAWDLVVDETSGAMAAAVISRGGYLMFGGCSMP
jgi:hypothetical protein